MPSVVIVDDSSFFRTYIAQIVEEIGIKVIASVSDGLNAISKTTLLKPDLLILDLVLPKMDGLSVLKKIMQSNPTKIIVISSFNHNNMDLAFTALEYGALAFINKPTVKIEYNDDFKSRLQPIIGIDRN